MISPFKIKYIFSPNEFAILTNRYFPSVDIHDFQRIFIIPVLFITMRLNGHFSLEEIVMLSTADVYTRSVDFQQ